MNIKPFLLTLIISLFLSVLVRAQQGATNRPYSVAIKGFSLETLPKILNDKQSSKFVPLYVNGGSVYFNENEVAMRLGASVYQLDKMVENSSTSDERIEGKVDGYSLRFGAVKNFNFSTIQPYFGIDLGYRFQKFSNDGKELSSTYYVNTNKNSGFVVPSLGVKVNIISELSLFVESEFQILFSYERVNEKRAGDTYTFSKYNKFEFLPNPVILGVQFNFGSVN